MSGTRRRGEVLRKAIYAAALAEITAAGVGGLTMDGIASRAQAARSSLYRRWNSPEDLVLDALNNTIPREITVPDHGDLRADMLAVLTELAAVLGGPAGPAMVTLLGERHRRPDLIKDLDERVFAPRGEVTEDVLRRAVDRGDIHPEVLTPLVTDVGFVQVFFHYLAHAEPPDSDQLAAIVDELVLPALHAPTGDPDAPPDQRGQGAQMPGV